MLNDVIPLPSMRLCGTVRVCGACVCSCSQRSSGDGSDLLTTPAIVGVIESVPFTTRRCLFVFFSFLRRAGPTQSDVQQQKTSEPCSCALERKCFSSTRNRSCSTDSIRGLRKKRAEKKLTLCHRPPPVQTLYKVFVVSAE